MRWGIPDVGIGLVLWLLGGIAGAVMLLLTGQIDLETGEMGELAVWALALTLVPTWVGLAGWPVVVTYWKGRRSLAADFGFRFTPLDMLWGVLVGGVCLVMSVSGSIAWMLITGDEEPPTNTGFIPDDPGLLSVLGLFALIALAVPVVEELFFRGLFLRAFDRRFGPVVAVVVSSVVFGVFHFGGDSFAQGLFMVGVTGLYGALLAVVTLLTGRLGAAIIGHVVINAVGVSAALLAG